MEGISRLDDYTGRFLKQNPVISPSFYSMKDLFLNIKGFRIFLNQGDQLLIRLIKILQASNGQDHHIVQIGVVL